MSISKEKSDAKIRNWIKGSRWEQIKTDYKKEFADYKRRHKGFKNRVLYFVVIGVILLALTYFGGVLADVNLPKVIPNENFLEYKKFDVNVSRNNVHHQNDLLVIATERIEYDMIFTNKNEKDSFFRVSYSVNNAGESTSTFGFKEFFIKSGEKESETFGIYMKKPGINGVTFNVIVYNATERGGQMQKEIGSGMNTFEKSYTFTERVFSREDYNFQVERSWLYRFIVIAAAPFVIISVKYLRDIAEGR